MVNTDVNRGVQRSEIADEYKWKVEDIYPDMDAWEADFQHVKERIPGVEQYKGRLGESADILLEYLRYNEETEQIALKLFQYAARKRDEDTRVSKNQSLFTRVLSLFTELSSATAFVVPEILSIPLERIESFLNSNKDLSIYRHYLDDITRVKEHILSEEVERVLAMTLEIASAPSRIYNILNDADIEYPVVKDEEGREVKLTKGLYLKLMQSKDRRVRKEAFEAFYKPYDGLKNTIATTLAADVKSNVLNARIRKYNSALEASLDKDNISVSVYENLIKTVSDNLEPMHKYIRLRKKLLELNELHMYDIYVSIIKGIDISIPYEKAKEMVLEAVRPLGKEYCDIMKKGFESRWIDVFESEGKAGGAYSSGVYGVHPFVLLNYHDTLDNAFTLAHEMGHALHSYFSNKNQPYIYHRYKIFLAEVASTLNEHLLREYLLKTTDDKGLKLVILNQFLEQFRGTVYRQTLFAEFEKIIYEKVEQGIPLTHELLGNLYHELNEKYYGPDIIIDQQISLEWARIPHFYMNFYVYKYATGFSAATYLAEKILKEGEPAVQKYMEFLKAGDSDYPLNILKRAGVDMNSPEPIVEALETFRKAVDEVEKLTAE